jgi:hypothetical protein
MYLIIESRFQKILGIFAFLFCILCAGVYMYYNITFEGSYFQNFLLNLNIYGYTFVDILYYCILPFDAWKFVIQYKKMSDKQTSKDANPLYYGLGFIFNTVVCLMISDPHLITILCAKNIGCLAVLSLVFKYPDVRKKVHS